MARSDRGRHWMGRGLGWGWAGPDWLHAALGALAVACLAGGLLIERGLFFAEATHTVTLYYGAEKA